MVHTLRSRGFALCVHVGLWLLLLLAVTHLGGNAPVFRATAAFSLPSQTPVPVAKLSALFSSTPWPKPPANTGSANAFFTRYFVPVQAPAPPPPTTRKIDLTYLGFYQTADGPRNAVLKVADDFVVAPVGTAVASHLFVADAAFQTLTLTNLAAQTNLLPLNIKKELEVPIR